MQQDIATTNEQERCLLTLSYLSWDSSEVQNHIVIYFTFSHCSNILAKHLSTNPVITTSHQPVLIGILKYLKMFNNFSHRKCCKREILLHTETKSWNWNHTVNTVPIRVEEAEGRLSCFLNLIYKDQISLCWKLKSIKIKCVMVKRIFYLLWCLLHQTLIVWNHSYKI